MLFKDAEIRNAGKVGRKEKENFCPRKNKNPEEKTRVLRGRAKLGALRCVALRKGRMAS
jgi:hypothetical protein